MAPEKESNGLDKYEYAVSVTFNSLNSVIEIPFKMRPRWKMPRVLKPNY